MSGSGGDDEGDEDRDRKGGSPNRGPEQYARGGRRPAFSRRGRVTLDFTGPPLSLPEEESSEGDGQGGELELDTEELEQEDAARAERSASDAGSPLDLDMSAFGAQEPQQSQQQAGPEPEDPPDGHDAWTLDRRRRVSTVPPPHSETGEARRGPATPVPDGAHEPARPSSAPAGPASAPAPERDQRDSEGHALELVDRSQSGTPEFGERRQTVTQELDFAGEMVDRYALGDFSGALRAAELLLGREPEHEEAARYAHACRERLEQLYSARLGSLSEVPQVAVAESEKRWLGLDHRAASLLAEIDGERCIEGILQQSSMARIDTLKTLTELLDLGAIRFS